MKKLVLLSLVALCALSLSAQEFMPPMNERFEEPEKKAAVTIGILNGGGSLVGVDFEFLVSDRVGLQIGGGFVGFGAGLNYHLKPGIRSSAISFQYWHQGMGDTFTQGIAGATYNFRAKKIFTFQIGAGFRVQEGPAYEPMSDVEIPFMLMYSIGIYLPI